MAETMAQTLLSVLNILTYDGDTLDCLINYSLLLFSLACHLLCIAGGACAPVPTRAGTAEVDGNETENCGKAHPSNVQAAGSDEKKPLLLEKEYNEKLRTRRDRPVSETSSSRSTSISSPGDTHCGGIGNGATSRLGVLLFSLSAFSAGIFIFQVILCEFVGCVGVSIVWSALVAWLWVRLVFACRTHVVSTTVKKDEDDDNNNSNSNNAETDDTEQDQMLNSVVPSSLSHPSSSPSSFGRVPCLFYSLLTLLSFVGWIYYFFVTSDRLTDLAHILSVVLGVIVGLVDLAVVSTISTSRF